MTEAESRHHHVTAADGIRLFADDHGPLDGALTPLVCLPGLTRNSKDFEPVFARHGAARRVIGLDFRGRGRSSHATDPASYRPDVELADTLAVLDQLGLSRVAVLGTSRGGIVGMIMAATVQERLAGLCLNDVGARLEPAGLLRIVGYAGKSFHVPSWPDAAMAMMQNSHGFSGVSEEQWLAAARRVYREVSNGISHNYDLALAASLPSVADIEAGKVGELWDLLPTLADTPVALLRGEGSDLLSMETAARMKEALPQLRWSEIAGRGHVPFLDEAESVSTIDAWLADVDANEKGRR